MSTDRYLRPIGSLSQLAANGARFPLATITFLGEQQDITDPEAAVSGARQTARFSFKSRIRVRRADMVQATRRLNRRRLASSPTTRNGAHSQSALPRVGVGWSRGWPPPAVPERLAPRPTASQNHECKVDGALRRSRSIWCPMERNREHRATRRRAVSAPDPRDNARIPCSGRRALFLGCTPRNVWIGTLGTAQKCRDFHDWTQQDPARSIVVSLLRGSAPLGQREVTQ